MTEEHPLQGQSPYSASKIGADQLAHSFPASFGVPVTTIRPFNTYGPRQSARAVIPTVIAQIASGARRIKLGALHPTRDFSYVKDTVAGFVAALTSDAGVGEVINLGSGFEFSIGATAEAIARVMGVSVELECDEARLRPQASEVERLLADNGKAKRLLAWTPEYAGIEGFERGLRETAAWFRSLPTSRRTSRAVTTSEHAGHDAGGIADTRAPLRRAARGRRARAAAGGAARARVSPATSWRTSRNASTPDGCRRPAGIVDEFEHRLAEFTGSRLVVATVNGTAALHMALKLAGVQPGDEVLVPSLTFVATANAVAHCGAVRISSTASRARWVSTRQRCASTWKPLRSVPPATVRNR